MIEKLLYAFNNNPRNSKVAGSEGTVIDLFLNQ